MTIPKLYRAVPVSNRLPSIGTTCFCVAKWAASDQLQLLLKYKSDGRWYYAHQSDTALFMGEEVTHWLEAVPSKEDKRYLLFAYYTYQAYGGMEDSRGSFDELEEAIRMANDLRHDTVVIYDRIEGVEVAFNRTSTSDMPYEI